MTVMKSSELFVCKTDLRHENIGFRKMKRLQVIFFFNNERAIIREIKNER